jgi:hypothetical protein
MEFIMVDKWTNHFAIVKANKFSGSLKLQDFAALTSQKSRGGSLRETAVFQGTCKPGLLLLPPSNHQKQNPGSKRKL